MKYIEFDSSKKYDLILLGRIAVDLITALLTKVPPLRDTSAALPQI